MMTLDNIPYINEYTVQEFIVSAAKWWKIVPSTGRKECGPRKLSRTLCIDLYASNGPSKISISAH